MSGSTYEEKPKGSQDSFEGASAKPIGNQHWVLADASPIELRGQQGERSVYQAVLAVKVNPVIASSFGGESVGPRCAMTLKFRRDPEDREEIADQLWQEPLVGIEVPIVVTVESPGMQGRVSRDGSGVVRIDGRVPRASEGSEAQKIRGAAALLDIVFEKSLNGWGLKEIRTNDASGRGEP